MLAIPANGIMRMSAGQRACWFLATAIGSFAVEWSILGADLATANLWFALLAVANWWYLLSAVHGCDTMAILRVPFMACFMVFNLPHSPLSRADIELRANTFLLGVTGVAILGWKHFDMCSKQAVCMVLSLVTVTVVGLNNRATLRLFFGPATVDLLHMLLVVTVGFAAQHVGLMLMALISVLGVAFEAYNERWPTFQGEQLFRLYSECTEPEDDRRTVQTRAEALAKYVAMACALATAHAVMWAYADHQQHLIGGGE